MSTSKCRAVRLRYNSFNAHELHNTDNHPCSRFFQVYFIYTLKTKGVSKKQSWLLTLSCILNHSGFLTKPNYFGFMKNQTILVS